MEDETELIGGDKDYIISILEEMDEEELDTFDVRFRIIDKRETLIKLVRDMDETNEDSIDKLSSIYRYVRDSYWNEVGEENY